MKKWAVLSVILAVAQTACSDANFGLAESDAGDDASDMSDAADAVAEDSADAIPATETSADSVTPTDSGVSSETSVLDASPDVLPDAPVYPPLDPCFGFGATGDVIIGVCKPQASDPGYLAVAGRVLYPSGTISPNEEWKNPWPMCTSSTVMTCICCKFRPSSGAPMPLKSDIDFKAGTNASPGGGVDTALWPTGSDPASYYGYWGPTLVGRVTGGKIDPVLTALKPPPSGYLGNLLFHYE